MNFLVDTCGWIEWISDEKLAPDFAPYLRQPKKLIVPTIIQFELYKWICHKKDETLALNIIGVTEQGNVIPLDSSLALLAAELAKQYQLSMADAIVYATAQQHQVQLITCDKHFKTLPNVKYYSK